MNACITDTCYPDSQMRTLTIDFGFYINRYMENPDNYVFDKDFMHELECVSHREYGTGYFFDEPQKTAQITKDGGYIKRLQILGKKLLKAMMKIHVVRHSFRETRHLTATFANLFHPVSRHVTFFSRL